MSEKRGRRDRKKQGIVPPQAPKRKWEAIRALPEKLDNYDIQSQFERALQEAQALLPEYEAQSGRLKRAVELLKSARGKLSVSWDEAVDLVDVIDGFLRELEGDLFTRLDHAEDDIQKLNNADKLDPDILRKPLKGTDSLWIVPSDYTVALTEMEAQIEEVARRRLGLSVAEVEARIDSGEYKMDEDNYELWSWLKNMVGSARAMRKRGNNGGVRVQSAGTCG